LLEELDGAVFNRFVAGNRIKSFRARERDNNLPVGQRSISFRRREEEMDSEREEEEEDIVNLDVAYIPEG